MNITRVTLRIAIISRSGTIILTSSAVSWWASGDGCEDGDDVHMVSFLFSLRIISVPSSWQLTVYMYHSSRYKHTLNDYKLCCVCYSHVHV